MKICECLAICVGAVIGTLPAHAHHASSAVFSNEDIEIEGVVTEFNFKNPHVNLTLRVTDESGTETLWMVTAPATPGFRRRGWSAETIQEGQYLRLPGKMSRNGTPMMLLESADIQSGNILELDPADGSIVRRVVGTVDESPAEIGSLSARLDDGRPNLTGTWSGGTRANRSSPPYNGRGAALQAKFDAINDPAWSECSDPGLVRQAATIHPLRIIQYDDHVVFEYEEFAGRREIYLGDHDPESREKTRFGHSIARYEDDALIVETTQLLGNLTGPLGNALSDRTTTVETYRRADGPEIGPAISMTMVIMDPEYLTGPWEFMWRKDFTAEAYEFIEVECRLPYQANE